MAKHGLLHKKFVGDLSLLNSSPLAKLLDSCLRSKSPAKETRRVHSRIIKSQFHNEVFIQNRLIDVYGKCRCIDYARKLFDRMPDRNTFSWNSIICGLMSAGLLDEGKGCFDLMPVPDQCSWNSMVSGFSQGCRFEESLLYLVGMHGDDFVLNQYSYGSALSACSGLRNLQMGIQIHGLMVKSPCSADVFMGSALIDMYSKYESVTSAQNVFDGMNQLNIVSWNSLITCYEQNGPASEALAVCMRMMDYGIEPDEVTLASVISACVSLSAVIIGQQIHSRVVKFDKFRHDLVICNALVDMYAKCNKIEEARWIFDTMPIRSIVSETSMVSGYVKVANVETARLMFGKMMERNVVSWNALIAEYTRNGENEVALGLFLQLKRESVWPTHYTFGNLLNACARLIPMC